MSHHWKGCSVDLKWKFDGIGLRLCPSHKMSPVFDKFCGLQGKQDFWMTRLFFFCNQNLHSEANNIHQHISTLLTMILTLKSCAFLEPHNSAYSPFVPKFREVFLAATSIGFQIQEQKTLWKQICAYQKVMEASKDRMAIALHIVDEYLLGYRIPCDMSQSFPSRLYIRCTHKDW